MLPQGVDEQRTTNELKRNDFNDPAFRAARSSSPQILQFTTEAVSSPLVPCTDPKNESPAIQACDGLCPITDPSVDVAQTSSAVSNPEGPSTNPLRFLGPEEQRQGLRGSSAVKSKTAQEGGKEAAEGAVYRHEEDRRNKPYRGVTRPRPGGIQNSTSGTGGAQRDISPPFWRSVTTPALEDKKQEEGEPESQQSPE
ncbi:hypothetical protein NDU88_002979 [Pleurodeles waltl]|uniref:Uncharacterized protein n=1 Tax=Pleurodeles waltl TaxID=8319 RepID=A0AAV7LDY7_PLEWA|nr:hypothetical protein NDU88_002979 [Pleurodeles waltl]